jgi:hypothetical protein
MDTPYRVEDYRTVGTKVEYAIRRTGDDVVVRGMDLVLLHRIAELLNEDVHTADTGR